MLHVIGVACENDMKVHDQ